MSILGLKPKGGCDYHVMRQFSYVADKLALKANHKEQVQKWFLRVDLVSLLTSREGKKP